MGLEEVRGADVGVVGLGSPLAKDFDGVLEDALLGSRGAVIWLSEWITLERLVISMPKRKPRL